MEIKYNMKLNNDGFTSTGFGVISTKKELGSEFFEQFEINGNRLGRFILCFNELTIRTSSNILSFKTDFFKPCSIKEFQQVSDLKDKGFKDFIKELESNEYISISNGVIYVNPLFAISFEMDYIRDELYSLFPRGKLYFDNINCIIGEDIIDE